MSLGSGVPALRPNEAALGANHPALRMIFPGVGVVVRLQTPRASASV